MNIQSVKPDYVRYNPSNNMFEALVTMETSHGRFRYACAVASEIDMPPSGAAFRLTQQAKLRHMARNATPGQTGYPSEMRQDAGPLTHSWAA